MIIGISSCFFHADPKRPIFKGKTLLYLEQSMVHWIMREGVVAYLIPSLEPGAPIGLKELIEPLDGLVLQGGSDISPKSYGEEPLKPEWSGDYIRDQYESALIHEFMAQKKPVLGICRGAQIINVALGGSMLQDIATQRPDALNHRNWDIYDQNFHDIIIEPGSKLEKLYKDSKTPYQGLKTNTIHHQGLNKLGRGLVAEACSPKDGIIEAIRFSGPEYVVGIEWHPEFQDPADATLLSSKPFLTEFLNEARISNKRRSK